MAGFARRAPFSRNRRKNSLACAHEADLEPMENLAESLVCLPISLELMGVSSKFAPNGTTTI